MQIKQIRNLLEITQEIINLAEEKGWGEAELVGAINLLSTKIQGEIDNKAAVKSLI